MKQILAVVILGAALGGCAGANYAMQNYNGVPVQRVETAGDNWRIFDKPDEGRMMVTSSIGAAMAQGLGQGLLFNAVDNTPPEPQFRQAARAYLDSTGREACQITDAYLIVRPQFEVTYDCPSE